MRTISKQRGHWRINQRNQNPPATAPEAESAWQNYRHKQDARETCLAEQFGLCAYSETVLNEAEPGMHLDHVEPKSKNPARTFDHANLLLSAIDHAKLKTLARHDVFGGHFRLNRYSKSEIGRAHV